MEKYTNIEGIHFQKNVQNISYPDHGNELCNEIEDDSFWFQHRIRIISLVVKRYLKLGSRIVDLGGGNGFVANELQNQGYDTTLVEVGKGVFNAKKRGQKKIYCANILDFEPSETPIHMVSLLDVVEHITEPKDVYSHIQNKISKSSLILLTVPAGNILWSQDDINAGHFRRYTKGRLKEELDRSGYELVYARYFFSLLVLPIFIAKAVPFKLSKKRSNPVPTAVSDTYISEHTSILSKILLKILSFEIVFFRMGIPIPFGSSIIAIAKYKNTN